MADNIKYMNEIKCDDILLWIISTKMLYKFSPLNFFDLILRINSSFIYGRTHQLQIFKIYAFYVTLES